MCLNPVKTIPKRYFSSAFLRKKVKTLNPYAPVQYETKVINTDLYAGKLHNESKYAYYPCGKCYQCRESRIESWQIRWKEHLKSSIAETTYLLTLTYNDENIPYITTELNGEYTNTQTTLNYKDVQKFLKRLRKYQDKYCKKNNIPHQKISYHGCGEYGNKNTKRPHYHILITNILINPELIEIIWGNGHVHYGNNITDTTIKYVLKYTLKNSLVNQKTLKITKSNGEYKYTIVAPKQKNQYRIAEKTFCSKGIGKTFLTQDRIEYYERNPTANYLWLNYTKDGKCKEKPLPRYYKELIFNPNLLNELGRIIRDDHGRPKKKYDPFNEDFETTPRYKKLLLSYKREKERVKQIVTLINQIGYEQYLINQKHEKHNKYRLFKEDYYKRQTLQEDKNRYTGAHYI